ncbi:MAG TPA: hypothetical protein VFV50_09610 [Bdellovibrionales bacterium]|nr:hypothetical protein [Bdellovibrionales bacterium]
MRWPPPAQKGHVNYHWFDRFTLVHFAIGAAYGALGLSSFWALFLAVAWETAENPMKAYFPYIFPNATADTWKNLVGDILAVMTGWFLASQIVALA